MTRQQFGIALIVIAVAALVGGAVSERLFARAPAAAEDALPPPEKIIEAEAFRLLDAQGKTRAVLALEAGEPVLSLTDSEGHARVSLVASVPEAGLRVLNADGKERVFVGEMPDTAAAVTLYDYRGRPRAAMGEAAGEVKLVTVDTDGNNRFLLQMKGNGTPTLQILDPGGRTLWSTAAGRATPRPPGR